ncbi:MAG: hypothetical protein FJY10_11375 [Bacteroidetes bacterium]|nr:hypothetical protein [Bacteroidota bacterium]
MERMPGNSLKKTIDILTPDNQWIHTITADNGKEFAQHEAIAQALNIDFFFARPYHSWERGANENTKQVKQQAKKKIRVFVAN